MNTPQQPVIVILARTRALSANYITVRACDPMVPEILNPVGRGSSEADALSDLVNDAGEAGYHLFEATPH